MSGSINKYGFRCRRNKIGGKDKPDIISSWLQVVNYNSCDF
jgi:hypothetical protein